LNQKCFEQLFNAISGQVMEWQSDGKKVAHTGLSWKQPGGEGIKFDNIRSYIIHFSKVVMNSHVFGLVSNLLWQHSAAKFQNLKNRRCTWTIQHFLYLKQLSMFFPKS